MIHLKDLIISLKNTCSLSEVIELTKNDYRDSSTNKLSFYKIILRPIFFLITDGELAHDLIMIIGKLLQYETNILREKNKSR